jgi:hypothetical protein
MLWDNFKLEVRDKTIDHCKKLANSKKNEIKKLKNELKYLEEPSNTSTYKEGGKYGNIFFSEAIALIEPKLCINHWKVLYEVCVFYVDCNSKMTTTAGHSFYIGPIYTPFQNGHFLPVLTKSSNFRKTIFKGK